MFGWYADSARGWVFGEIPARLIPPSADPVYTHEHAKLFHGLSLPNQAQYLEGLGAARPDLCREFLRVYGEWTKAEAHRVATRKGVELAASLRRLAAKSRARIAAAKAMDAWTLPRRNTCPSIVYLHEPRPRREVIDEFSDLGRILRPEEFRAEMRHR